MRPLDVNFAFSINYANCKSAADLVVGAKDQLSILFRLAHVGGTQVTSDMELMLLEYVLSGEDNDMGPVEEAAAQDGPTGKKDPVFEKLVTTVLPWLQHLDAKQGFSGCGSSGDGADGAGDAAELDEDDTWAGLADLERARVAEAAHSAMLPDSDFVARPRGGRSQILASWEGIHAMHGAVQWARCRAMGEGTWTDNIQGDFY